MSCTAKECQHGVSLGGRGRRGTVARRAPTHLDVAGAGEVLAVFVERHSHDAVRRVKGLLDTVAVVDVNVNVQDALVNPVCVCV